jgi:hypothetical protein
MSSTSELCVNSDDLFLSQTSSSGARNENKLNLAENLAGKEASRFERKAFLMRLRCICRSGFAH